jgi:hypothetical protein
MIPRSIFLTAEAAQDRLVRATFNEKIAAENAKKAIAQKAIAQKIAPAAKFFVVRSESEKLAVVC